MEEPDRVRRSKMLSLWLRHKPESGGLELSKDGWVTIADVLSAFDRSETPTLRWEFDELVRLDAKGRFEVEGERVRARYGHSVVLAEQPHPGMPPTTLFHGTARRYVPKILETGLRPMKRQFVHLSPDRKTAREVGRRRDQEPAILVIAAHAAHEAGVRFYPRGKGVWLSDPVPPAFLSVEEDRSAAANGEVPTHASARDAAPGTPRRRRPRGGFGRYGAPDS
jgi:putative RNA 2'-phosphotransferase